MTRIVIDTNGVVSRTISRTGAPGEILRLWRRGELELAVSEAILAEYERALSYERVRERHGRSAEGVRAVVAEFRELALVVEPRETPSVVEADPDDDKFLWCAEAAGAEFVVTRDEHLLGLREYDGLRIASPAAFLEFLRAQRDEERG